MIDKCGGVVKEEINDTELAVSVNMAQLKFIKELDCVEKISEYEDEFLTLLRKEKNATMQNAQTMTLTADEPVAMSAVEATEGAEASVACVTSSSSCCQSNSTMETAREIQLEQLVSGQICCPGAEQWFKFTTAGSGTYTIYTTGSLDTEGTLYDCDGFKLEELDNYNGRINFRIVADLATEELHYIKVTGAKQNTGSYTLRVTEDTLVDSVSINKTTITLEKGVTYELPITPNYTYKGYNGAQRIPGLSVSINPSNANEQKIWWWEQYGSVLDCSYGWDDDGDRYIHVTATGIGTAKLYAVDWNENGKRDECVVHVDNMLIYRTRNRERLGFNDSSDNNDTTPITAEDLTYGGKSTQTLISNGTSISMSDLNNYSSISQRVTIIKNFFNSQISYDETFMTILSEMVDHFVAGTGTDYTNAALTAAVKSHSRTISYVNVVIALVKNYISQHKDTIGNLAYDEDLWTQPVKRSSHPLVKAMNDAISNGVTELYLPSYGFNNGVPGLTLALDGFYGNKIRLVNFQSTGNTYSCALEFTFYDHFGLDTPDLRDEKYSSMTAGMFPGFRQWFILQHWNNLEGSVQPKPFVTNVTFSVSISGTYE